MIHLYASEFVAGISCFALLAFAVFLAFRSSTSTGAPWLIELMCYLVSTCAMCRFLSQGKRCQWPAGVSYKGRVAVVVGASSGVGFAVAEELAEHDWTVILAGRDMTRLLHARERIFYALEEKKAIKRQSALLRVVLPWLPRCVRVRVMGYKRPTIRGFNVLVLATVDLASEPSVRAYVETLKGVQKTYPISLLVNAAGVMHRHTRYCPSYSEWPGLETMIATNAVGSQLLTRLVLPMLAATADASGVTSRVVNVASSCHTWLFTSPSQLLPFWPRRSSGASVSPNPIEMLYGLECHAPVVQKKALPADQAKGVPSHETKIREAYKIRDFSFFNFVGYYGLSKLCVVWNTQLTARLVSHPSYRFDEPAGAAAGGDTTSASTAPRRCGAYKIYVASCHPGIIVSGLYRELLPDWILYKVLYYPSLLIGKTWREGAQSALKVAIETDAMTLGGYFLCSGEYGPDSGVCCLSAHARDPALLNLYAKYLAEKLGDDFGAAKPVSAA